MLLLAVLVVRWPSKNFDDWARLEGDVDVAEKPFEMALKGMCLGET